MNGLGEKIWRLREQRGLSQEEFAEALGVSRQTVSNWENGKATPDALKFGVLCKVLQVSADELLETGRTSPPAEEAPKGEKRKLAVPILFSALAAVLLVLACVLLALPRGEAPISSLIVFTPLAGGIALFVLAAAALVTALLLFFKRK